MSDCGPAAQAELHAPASGPVTFAGVRGWLHAPVVRWRDTGVVVVPPIGRDARCVYMPTRLLAEDLANAGYPTLRYDHPGAGDSLETPAGVELYAAWLDGVRRAIDQLRGLAGVRRVVVAGLRFGGTLAALSAAHADGLMLLAPVLNGRSWLRRLRFSTAVLAGRDAPAQDEYVYDAGELCLSKETATAIGNIDLAALPAPAVPAFIAAQNTLVGAYADKLPNAAKHDFPGFKELFVETHSNLPPSTTFESARNWLEQTFGEYASENPPKVSLPLGDATLRPPGAVERIVSFGEGLWGVLCEPVRPARDGAAVVFCSTGGDPRAGVGAFATETARNLALKGVASLRFDYSGLGDSAMPGDEVRCHVFETPREGENDAAVAFMKSCGYADITLFGVCAGAYHALRTAWTNPDVTGVFAVSPVKLVWRSGDSLTFGRYKNGRPTGVYLKALLDPSAWRQAFAGQVDVTAVFLTLLGRLRSRITGLATQSAPDAPLRRMEQFSRRGGRSCFIMGINDASLEELATYFGPDGKRLSRLANTTVEVIPDLDHGLASDVSRTLAATALQDWLASLRRDSATQATEPETGLAIPQSGLGCSAT